MNKLDTELKELEYIERIQYLSLDPVFGILTRPALNLLLKETYSEPLSIHIIDINGLHKLNKELGYAIVNNQIRDALHYIKSMYPYWMHIGRVYSGDEIAFITRKENDIHFNQLSLMIEAFERYNIGFKFIYQALPTIIVADARVKFLDTMSDKLNTGKYLQIK